MHVHPFSPQPRDVATQSASRDALTSQRNCVLSLTPKRPMGIVYTMSYNWDFLPTRNSKLGSR
jgi:hypothetical protein